mmetsp:Transcript_28878/g.45283  ORF Transcript_28878/g.45283 Transcript_28878/m.45283 type:complete len:200 (+) Transcript_28878:1276-1875(+)
MQESVPEEKAREYASYILNPPSRQSPKFASNFRYTAENRSMPYALEHAVQAVTRKIREVEGGCYLTWAATLDEDTRRLHFNSLVATYARSQYEKLDRPAPELPNDNQKTLENLLRTLPCVQELLLKANGVLENIVGDHFEIDDIVANLDTHDVHTLRHAISRRGTTSTQHSTSPLNNSADLSMVQQVLMRPISTTSMPY